MCAHDLEHSSPSFRELKQDHGLSLLELSESKKDLVVASSKTCARDITCKFFDGRYLESIEEVTIIGVAKFQNGS